MFEKFLCDVIISQLEVRYTASSEYRKYMPRVMRCVQASVDCSEIDDAVLKHGLKEGTRACIRACAHALPVNVRPTAPGHGWGYRQSDPDRPQAKQAVPEHCMTHAHGVRACICAFVQLPYFQRVAFKAAHLGRLEVHARTHARTHARARACMHEGTHSMALAA